MLEWDFCKTITNADAVGANIHYFNEKSQSFYLKDGDICGLVSDVDWGNWNGNVEGDYKILDSNFISLSLDHSHDGILYGLITDGTSIWYLRYIYIMDISAMYESGRWQEQIDNQVKSFAFNMKNLGSELFSSEVSLFNPGSKITVQFSAGDSNPYDIGVVYVDDLDFDAYANTIPISTRNSVGFFLSEQTFDDKNIYSGGRSVVLSAILVDSGISTYHIQQDDTLIGLEFDPGQTILQGLNDTLNSIGWRMIELPNGYIVIGDEAYISGYNSNGRYTFDGGKEAFKRQTSKNADAAYTRVCVKNSNDVRIYRSVPCWSHWNIGSRKTKYYDAPEGAAISEMEALADKLVTELQYVGVGEEFSGPIRPQLQVGDVAEVFYQGDAEPTSLGIITRVTHEFGSGGFRTDFSLDSGGTATDAENYTITKAAVLNGYNRKQRVSDFIGLVAEKKVTSVYAGGGQIAVQSTLPETNSTTPASIIKIL